MLIRTRRRRLRGLLEKLHDVARVSTVGYDSLAAQLPTVKGRKGNKAKWLRTEISLLVGNWEDMAFHTDLANLDIPSVGSAG